MKTTELTAGTKRRGMLCDYKIIEVIDDVATGEKMRRHRKHYGISLRALAKAMKVSAPFLSDLELGRRNWSNERVLSFNTAVMHARIKGIQENMKNAHKLNLKLD
jgi:predicted transcriptional regulator